MAQQTAIDWLYNMMLKPLSEWPDDLWEQAKEMEENRMANYANEYADAVMGGCTKRAEQYYKEIFTKKSKNGTEHQSEN